MDIWLHILLICIIGGFFFLDRWMKNTTQLMFVILFSTFGIFFVLNDNIEIVDYNKYTETIAGNVTTVQYEVTNADNLGLGLMNLENFIVLIYFWMFFIGSFNFAVGKQEE